MDRRRMDVSRFNSANLSRSACARASNTLVNQASIKKEPFLNQNEDRKESNAGRLKYECKEFCRAIGILALLLSSA